MGDAHVVRAFDVGGQLLAVFVERAGVDFAGDEEVRDGGPALRGALGHEAAEGSWVLRCLPDLFSGSAVDAAGAARGLHVRSENLAAGAGAAQARDIDA